MEIFKYVKPEFSFLSDAYLTAVTLIQSKKFEQLLLGKRAAFSCFAVNFHSICPSLSGKYCSESLTVKKIEAEKLLVNWGRRKVSYT